MILPSMIKTMILIRIFEEKIEEFFSKGILRGTTHCSIGQELTPASIGELIDIKNDYIFATHRGHGYFLACTKQPYLLACEMMGRRDGPVYGGGGSQHIKYENFYTNGITGGMTPIAVGTALSLKRQKKNNICVSILGDGGFNEGYVQEALNLAAINQAPVLFLLENNKFAMSTRTSEYMSGTIEERVRSYHIPYTYIKQEDLNSFHIGMRQIISDMRKLKTPQFVEIDTYRFCGHSKSDSCEYMDLSERETYLKIDPLKKIFEQMEESEVSDLINETKNEVKKAFENAERCCEITLDEFIALKAEERENANGNYS